jgi:hypothetical protein
MADITVNGVDVDARTPVAIVIRPGQPDQDAAVAAAEQLVLTLTGKQPQAATDWDDTVTVTAGRLADARAGAAPALTADQQLVEDQAALYRRAIASEAIATRNEAVYKQLRMALRGMIEAAWGLRTVTARELVDHLAEDDRPVWAIFYERKGVPLDQLAALGKAA